MLRHTTVVWSLAAGVRIEVLSEQLGHASLQITYDVYGGLINLHDPVMAEAMAKEMLTISDAIVPESSPSEVEGRKIRPGRRGNQGKGQARADFERSCAAGFRVADSPRDDLREGASWRSELRALCAYRAPRAVVQPSSATSRTRTGPRPLPPSSAGGQDSTQPVTGSLRCPYITRRQRCSNSGTSAATGTRKV
jgi:hypothetical protein